MVGLLGGLGLAVVLFLALLWVTEAPTVESPAAPAGLSSAPGSR
jgi:hypothetical protein